VTLQLLLLKASFEFLDPRIRRLLALFVFAAIAISWASASFAIANESAGGAPALQSTPAKGAVDQLIPWLLDEDRQLRGIPFAEVILDTTGKHVLAVDAKNETDQRVIKQISAACDETIKQMNTPDSVIQRILRINEVSSYFEDTLRELLSSTPGLSCDFPRTIDEKVQRSGYPDLRIIDLTSRRVFYLDPKLYAAGSRNSSFRTFYFEPKKATNKVGEDAVHFIVGFEHERREGGSSSPGSMAKAQRWKFTRWNLVDLSHFKVKLKAEFQGSNDDMYRAEAIVASGRGD